MNRPEKINRLNDALVKHIFASEERKSILLSLINAILVYAKMSLLLDIEFLNRELDAKFFKSKTGRVDILGRTSDKTLVNVEFQIARLSSMGERSLFYWSYIYRLKKGQRYDELPRTICINILDFELFDDDQTPDFFNSFGITNLKYHSHKLSPTFEMHFIEIPKWERLKTKNSIDLWRIEKWLSYFSPKIDEKKLKEIAKEVPEIGMALAAEVEFMNNADLRFAYDTVEKDRRDAIAHEAYWRNLGRNEGFQNGFQDGEKKGFQDGLQKGKLDGWNDGRKDGIRNDRLGIIANMRRKGFSLEDISDVTGISLGEVRTLSTQIQ